MPGAGNTTMTVGDGRQRALGNAETLSIPFMFSSNGDGYDFHNRTGTHTPRSVITHG